MIKNSVTIEISIINIRQEHTGTSYPLLSVKQTKLAAYDAENALLM